MKTIKLYEENWAGARLNSVEYVAPDLKMALLALDRMDGKNRTTVQYQLVDDDTLTVGGDGNLFVVSLALGIDAEIFTLIDPNKSAESFEHVVTGGQMGEFPSNQCVGRDLAARAIAYFIEHGTADKNLRWQPE